MKMNNKGMSTIEAVVIIPICLSVIMLLFWCGIYFYNRGTISQAAARAAICGSQKSYWDNEEIVDYVTEKVYELTKDKLMLMDNTEVNVTVNASEITVNIIGYMDIPSAMIMGGIYSAEGWSIDITSTACRIKNSMFLRSAKRIKETIYD